MMEGEDGMVGRLLSYRGEVSDNAAAGVAKLRVGKSTRRMTGVMDCTAILSTSFGSRVKSETGPVALGKDPMSPEAFG
jgi:hypothetical protein